MDIKHSSKMAKALMSNGKVFEYLELEDGDHRLSLQRNRTMLFERMASFLETHLRKKEGETPNTGALAAIEHYSEDTAGNGTMEPDTNLIGSDISNHVPSSADPRLCRSACAADSRCVAWTYVKSLKEGGVGSGFKISSNVEITLKDGTRAYRSEIRWFYIPMRVRLQTQLVSASKDGKIVSVTAHPLENAEPIPPIVESLRFDEKQSDSPESGAVL